MDRQDVGFDVVTAVSMKSTEFRVVQLCSLERHISLPYSGSKSKPSKKPA
jgi:hypothetical protein